MIIGLTGNMGTGKSTVAEILATEGFLRLDTDRMGRALLEKGGAACGPVSRWLGPEVLASDGSIDRAALAGIVFADPEKLRFLESIIHPRVAARVQEILDQCHRDDPVVLESALLFEAGMEGLADRIWVTRCPRPLQEQRIMERDRISRAQARLRIGAQMSQTEKCRRADAVIRTDVPRPVLHQAVRRLLRDL